MTDSPRALSTVRSNFYSLANPSYNENNNINVNESYHDSNPRSRSNSTAGTANTTTGTFLNMNLEQDVTNEQHIIMPANITASSSSQRLPPKFSNSNMSLKNNTNAPHFFSTTSVQKQYPMGPAAIKTRQENRLESLGLLKGSNINNSRPSTTTTSIAAGIINKRDQHRQNISHDGRSIASSSSKTASASSLTKLILGTAQSEVFTPRLPESFFEIADTALSYEKPPMPPSDEEVIGTSKQFGFNRKVSSSSQNRRHHHQSGRQNEIDPDLDDIDDEQPELVVENENFVLPQVDQMIEPVPSRPTFAKNSDESIRMNGNSNNNAKELSIPRPPPTFVNEHEKSNNNNNKQPATIRPSFFLTNIVLPMSEDGENRSPDRNTDNQNNSNKSPRIQHSHASTVFFKDDDKYYDQVRRESNALVNNAILKRKSFANNANRKSVSGSTNLNSKETSFGEDDAEEEPLSFLNVEFPGISDDGTKIIPHRQVVERILLASTTESGSVNNSPKKSQENEKNDNNNTSSNAQPKHHQDPLQKITECICHVADDLPVPSKGTRNLMKQFAAKPYARELTMALFWTAVLKLQTSETWIMEQEKIEKMGGNVGSTRNLRGGTAFASMRLPENNNNHEKFFGDMMTSANTNVQEQNFSYPEAKHHSAQSMRFSDGTFPQNDALGASTRLRNGNSIIFSPRNNNMNALSSSMVMRHGSDADRVVSDSPRELRETRLAQMNDSFHVAAMNYGKFFVSMILLNNKSSQNAKADGEATQDDLYMFDENDDADFDEDDDEDDDDEKLKENQQTKQHKIKKSASFTERPSENLSSRRPASRDYFVNLLPLLLARSAFFLVTNCFGRPKDRAFVSTAFREELAGLITRWCGLTEFQDFRVINAAKWRSDLTGILKEHTLTKFSQAKMEGVFDDIEEKNEEVMDFQRQQQHLLMGASSTAVRFKIPGENQNSNNNNYNNGKNNNRSGPNSACNSPVVGNQQLCNIGSKKPAEHLKLMGVNNENKKSATKLARARSTASTSSHSRSSSRASSMSSGSENTSNGDDDDENEQQQPPQTQNAKNINNNSNSQNNQSATTMRRGKTTNQINQENSNKGSPPARNNGNKKQSRSNSSGGSKNRKRSNNSAGSGGSSSGSARHGRRRRHDLMNLIPSKNCFVPQQLIAQSWYEVGYGPGRRGRLTHERLLEEYELMHSIKANDPKNETVAMAQREVQSRQVLADSNHNNNNHKQQPDNRDHQSAAEATRHNTSITELFHGEVLKENEHMNSRIQNHSSFSSSHDNKNMSSYSLLANSPFMVEFFVAVGIAQTSTVFQHCTTRANPPALKSNRLFKLSSFDRRGLRATFAPTAIMALEKAALVVQLDAADEADIEERNRRDTVLALRMRRTHHARVQTAEAALAWMYSRHHPRTKELFAKSCREVHAAINLAISAQRDSSASEGASALVEEGATLDEQQQQQHDKKRQERLQDAQMRQNEQIAHANQKKLESNLTARHLTAMKKCKQVALKADTLEAQLPQVYRLQLRELIKKCKLLLKKMERQHIFSAAEMTLSNAREVLRFNNEASKALDQLFEYATNPQILIDAIKAANAAAHAAKYRVYTPLSSAETTQNNKNVNNNNNNNNNKSAAAVPPLPLGSSPSRRNGNNNVVSGNRKQSQVSIITPEKSARSQSLLSASSSFSPPEESFIDEIQQKKLAAKYVPTKPPTNATYRRRMSLSLPLLPRDMNKTHEDDGDPAKLPISPPSSSSRDNSQQLPEHILAVTEEDDEIFSENSLFHGGDYSGNINHKSNALSLPALPEPEELLQKILEECARNESIAQSRAGHQETSSGLLIKAAETTGLTKSMLEGLSLKQQQRLRRILQKRRDNKMDDAKRDKIGSRSRKNNNNDNDDDDGDGDEKDNDGDSFEKEQEKQFLGTSLYAHGDGEFAGSRNGLSFAGDSSVRAMDKSRFPGMSVIMKSSATSQGGKNKNTIQRVALLPQGKSLTHNKTNLEVDEEIQERERIEREMEERNRAYTQGIFDKITAAPKPSSHQRKDNNHNVRPQTSPLIMMSNNNTTNTGRKFSNDESENSIVLSSSSRSDSTAANQNQNYPANRKASILNNNFDNGFTASLQRNFESNIINNTNNNNDLANPILSITLPENSERLPLSTNPQIKINNNQNEGEDDTADDDLFNPRRITAPLTSRKSVTARNVRLPSMLLSAASLARTTAAITPKNGNNNNNNLLLRSTSALGSNSNNLNSSFLRSSTVSALTRVMSNLASNSRQATFGGIMGASDMNDDSGGVGSLSPEEKRRRRIEQGIFARNKVKLKLSGQRPACMPDDL